MNIKKISRKILKKKWIEKICKNCKYWTYVDYVGIINRTAYGWCKKCKNETFENDKCDYFKKRRRK